MHVDHKKFWSVAQSTKHKRCKVKLHSNGNILEPPEQADILANYYMTLNTKTNYINY